MSGQHIILRLYSAPEWEAGVMPYCFVHGLRFDSADRLYLLRYAPFWVYAVATPSKTVIAELWERLEL
jgi:hypothetical protein